MVLVGDSSMNTVMLMVCWLGESMAVVAQYRWTRICSVMEQEATKKSTSENKPSRSIRRVRIIRLQRFEADSGRLWVQQQQPHHKARTLLVGSSISPYVTAEKYIHHRSASISCGKWWTWVYESNKQQVRENEIDMLTIWETQKQTSGTGYI